MPKFLREVADYCWSNNFLDVFRNFFADHAEAFEGAPAMQSGEHNMEYYELFQVYLKLYETTLQTYLQSLDVTIEEFYREVRQYQSDTPNEDPYLSVFVDCLLASCDYESFYKVMSKEGVKSKSRKDLLKSAGAAGSGGSRLPAEAKSAADDKVSFDRAERKITRDDVDNAPAEKKSSSNHK